MSKTLTEIAQQLRDADKKVQLIYAFNGSGKTRLSQEFKSLIDPNTEEDEGDCGTKVLYYNAFTEDLFYWDNNIDGYAGQKLKIHSNTYTDWLLREQGQDKNVINHFQHYVGDKLTPLFSADFLEVTFSLRRGAKITKNIKISKGEESNFIWSIFYILLDEVIDTLNEAESIEQSTHKYNQLEYVFIDDPVSSLDENHLIELAVNLADLIKFSKSGLKFIITTHSPIFYNVLHNELNKKTCYLLRLLDSGIFNLKKQEDLYNQCFSYHLYLKDIIEQAIAKEQVQKYHFMLLRNLYEKTANFLGYKKWENLLETADGDRSAYLKHIINFSSHRRWSSEEVAEPTEPEKQTVNILLNNLLKHYGYCKEEWRDSTD